LVFSFEQGSILPCFSYRIIFGQELSREKAGDDGENRRLYLNFDKRVAASNHPKGNNHAEGGIPKKIMRTERVKNIQYEEIFDAINSVVLYKNKILRLFL
jgi:hypothetical protein